MYFHQLAVEAGALTAADTWLSALPGPFGFGNWTAHVTPAILGCPVVLTERFAPEEVLALIDRHRVTVLASCSSSGPTRPARCRRWAGRWPRPSSAA